MDKLNYYNGFKVESKDDLEMVAAMLDNSVRDSFASVESKDDLEMVAAILDTSVRDSFASSCPQKINQDKSMWWTKKLNKLRKNTRRKLWVALYQNVLEHWESYREA